MNRKMLHGDFRQFSVERLLRFLVALGQDVEIVIDRIGIPDREPSFASLEERGG